MQCIHGYKQHYVLHKQPIVSLFSPVFRAIHSHEMNKKFGEIQVPFWKQNLYQQYKSNVSILSTHGKCGYIGLLSYIGIVYQMVHVFCQFFIHFVALKSSEDWREQKSWMYGGLHNCGYLRHGGVCPRGLVTLQN